jgi:hypothetical protein
MVKASRSIPLIALVAALSIGVYIVGSVRYYRLGFPLDDAWIHQTYARNLATYGEWAFLSGQSSAGSTAPLWSALLAVGYSFGLRPHIWTYFLGWLSLGAMAGLGVYGFGILCPERRKAAPWAGVFLALEWHLVWAAGSGMETLPYALILLGALLYLARGEINWLGLGMLIGLSVWLRPDGITLVGPALLVLYFEAGSWRKRLLAAGKLVMGIALFFLPYLLFNRTLAGTFWPNTFFAKQAEYAQARAAPFWRRIYLQAALPMVGAGAVLLPGFILMLISVVRRRAWGQIAGAVWFLGYLFLYAWRLPVTYQHGRYIIPAMPVYFLWSLAGLANWVQPAGASVWRRTLSRVWVLALALVLILFWGLGMRAYALDVAVIESEMVDTALWVGEHTEREALIAAHDIGALGYFAQRQLLDLAGLVSPEVITFINDETRLATYLDARGAQYLVTFPGWYPYLVRRAEQVFSTQGVFSPMLGGENMAVYRWPNR